MVEAKKSNNLQTSASLKPSDADALLPQPESFARRHIGPRPDGAAEMLSKIGHTSLDSLIDQAVPAGIRLRQPLDLPPARSEHEALAALKAVASKNQVFRSFIGRATTMHHAAGHSAERLGKSRLVHAIHTLSGRDFPRPARSAAELPDDGQRFDSARHRQRLVAGRSHRLRRSHDDEPPVQRHRRTQPVFRFRELSSAKHRSRPNTRQSARNSKSSSAITKALHSPTKSSARSCNILTLSAQFTSSPALSKKLTLPAQW